MTFGTISLADCLIPVFQGLSNCDRSSLCNSGCVISQVLDCGRVYKLCIILCVFYWRAFVIKSVHTIYSYIMNYIMNYIESKYSILCSLV